MNVNIEFRHRGEQVHRYGPQVYDFTITISDDRGTEFSAKLFEEWSRRVRPWQTKQSAAWWEWRLVKVSRIEKNKWSYIIQKPYDD